MAPSRKKGADRPSSLFAATGYDRDAQQYASVPTTEDVRASSSSHLEVGSEDGSDDDLSTTPHDFDVLKEEEEREKLLSKGGIFGGIGRKKGSPGVVIGKRVKGRKKKRSRGLVDPGEDVGDDSEERIGRAAGEYTSGEEDDQSEDEEIEEIWQGRYDEKAFDKKPRTPTIRRIVAITVALLTFLLVLIYASIGLSLPKKPTSPPKAPFHNTPLSNGTHTYYPTTIFISLDGFRADYLARNLTPTLQSFINSGVSSAYLTPSFPSVTFPNHWTLITGLYPESHGIVGNSFYDEILKKEYYYTDIKSASLPFWYGGDPIWSIAEENEVKSAIHMWPGSDQYIYHPNAFAATIEDFRNQETNVKKKMRMKPGIVDPFNGKELLPNKAARFFEWLDMPLETRPQLIFAYVPNLDAVGHIFGPDTPEEDAELKKVDDMFRLFLDGLEKRNLVDIVNIVVVSDHGMARTANERLIYLEDVLGDKNMEKIEAIEGWPLSGLRPITGANATEIYEEVVVTHLNWPPKSETGKKAVLKDGKPPWDAYLRDGNIPERWHFSNNHRISPIWIVPHVGWAMVTKGDYPPDNFPVRGYHPKGIHGYDNVAKEMRAIFVAHGPGFRELELHGAGREWLGLGNLDVHDAAHDISDTKTKRLGKRVDAKGMEIQGKLVKPFGNWEMYAMIGELVFGVDMSKQVLGPHNGTLVGDKGVLAALQVVEGNEDDGESDYPSISAMPSGGGSTASAEPSRPVIEKPSALASSTRAKPSDDPSEVISKPHVGVDEPTAVNSEPAVKMVTVTVVPQPKEGGGDEDGDEKEEPDLDHKPEGMSWWEWAKWRANKVKEGLEKWWGDVWDKGKESGKRN